MATVYDYVGCFDKNDVGVDQEKKEMGEDWFQTTAHCIAYCNYMNYPYAGIGEDERKLKYQICIFFTLPTVATLNPHTPRLINPLPTTFWDLSEYFMIFQFSHFLLFKEGR